MQDYIKKPESQSRTLDSSPKASRQAPIDVILQRYEERSIQQSADNEELTQGGFESAITSEQEPMQREKKPNNTGLPDNLKTGIENLSGYSMDDVKVHYNSDKPTQINALAYAQDTDIHVALGQEKHSPRETWHVVQQRQKVNASDSETLKKETDNIAKEINISTTQLGIHSNCSDIIQGAWEENGEFQKWNEKIFELNIFKKDTFFYYSETIEGDKIIFPDDSKFNFILKYVKSDKELTSRFLNEGQLTYVIKGSLISSGEGGATYYAIMHNMNQDTPKEICIKVPIENYQKEKDGHMLLADNSGNHLMKVYGFDDDKKWIYIEKMQASNPLDPKNEINPSKAELIKLKTDMFAALNELQSGKIIHGDIHLSNIMKGGDGNYKLIDFGETKRMPEKQNANETNMYFQNSIQILYAVYQAALYYSIQKKASTVEQEIMSDYYRKRITEREDYLKSQGITIDISERYKEIRIALSSIQTSLMQKKEEELIKQIDDGISLVEEAKDLIETFINSME